MHSDKLNLFNIIRHLKYGLNLDNSESNKLTINNIIYIFE